MLGFRLFVCFVFAFLVGWLVGWGVVKNIYIIKQINSINFDKQNLTIINALL